MKQTPYEMIQNKYNRRDRRIKFLYRPHTISQFRLSIMIYKYVTNVLFLTFQNNSLYFLTFVVHLLVVQNVEISVIFTGITLKNRYKHTYTR